MKLLKSLRKEKQVVYAFADGKIIRLEEIADQAFSNGLIGDGIAIETHSHEIYAPCEGIITMIAPTKHGFAITCNNNAKLLIHIGLNHNTNPDYYQYHASIGDTVDVNTCIVTLDSKLLKLHDEKILILMVVLNHQEHPIQTMSAVSSITRGKKLFTCK